MACDCRQKGGQTPPVLTLVSYLYLRISYNQGQQELGGSTLSLPVSSGGLLHHPL